MCIIYPDKAESLNFELKNQHFAPNLSKLAALPSDIFLVTDDKRWSANYYRDGIHSSADGNLILAEINSDTLKSTTH